MTKARDLANAGTALTSVSATELAYLDGVTSAGTEQESIGAAFCHDTFGGEWVQTSYNGNFKGKYAGIGDIWDGDNFVSPTVQEASSSIE